MPEEIPKKLLCAVMAIIKEERLKQKLTHEQLAYRARIHRTTVSHFEKDIRKPSLFVFLKLSKALGIEPWELLHRASKIIHRVIILGCVCIDVLHEYSESTIFDIV